MIRKHFLLLLGQVSCWSVGQLCVLFAKLARLAEDSSCAETAALELVLCLMSQFCKEMLRRFSLSGALTLSTGGGKKKKCFEERQNEKVAHLVVLPQVRTFPHESFCTASMG